MFNKLIIVLVLFTAVFVAGCNKPKSTEIPTPSPTPFSDIRLLKPGEGPAVDLVSRADKKAVTLSISGLTPDILQVGYELVYDTEGVQRGVLGSLDMKSGETKISKEILLASCSKNVCVFDKNVTKLFLTVKFSGDKQPVEFQKEYQLK